MSDAELPAFFRRADLLALPHLNVDVSGVLFAGLAFGKAMVLSAVGGFRELAEDTAPACSCHRDPRAWRRRSRGCWATRWSAAGWRRRAAAAAAGPFSWDASPANRRLYERVRA